MGYKYAFSEVLTCVLNHLFMLSSYDSIEDRSPAKLMKRGGSWKFFETKKNFVIEGQKKNQLLIHCSLTTFCKMSPPPSGKKHSESGLARFFGSATSGVLELFIFHPVDTVAKRLMSNQSRVSGSKWVALNELWSWEVWVWLVERCSPCWLTSAQL